MCSTWQGTLFICVGAKLQACSVGIASGQVLGALLTATLLRCYNAIHVDASEPLGVLHSSKKINACALLALLSMGNPNPFHFWFFLRCVLGWWGGGLGQPAAHNKNGFSRR